MPLQIVRGDLFLSGAQTLAHGCNTRGRMGAGIAVAYTLLDPLEIPIILYEEFRSGLRAREVLERSP